MKSVLEWFVIPGWFVLSAAGHAGLAYWMREAPPPERVIRIALDRGRTAVDMRASRARQVKPKPRKVEPPRPPEPDAEPTPPKRKEIPPPRPVDPALVIPKEAVEVPNPTEVARAEPPRPQEITPEMPRPEREPPPEPKVVAEVQAVQMPNSVATTGAVDELPSPLVNPTPAYPRDALIARQVGEVILRVKVGVDGRATAISVHRSSGVASLDASAEETVRSRWRFAPAKRSGRAVEHEVYVPVQFRIAG